MRRDDLLTADFVPYGVHALDRSVWVLKETAFGTRLWCSLNECAIKCAISRPILLGVYERAESRFIETTVRTGDDIVYAGVYIGFHAVHLARFVGESGHVDVFEPIDYLADALEASPAENGFADNGAPSSARCERGFAVAASRAAYGAFERRVSLRRTYCGPVMQARRRDRLARHDRWHAALRVRKDRLRGRNRARCATRGNARHESPNRALRIARHAVAVAGAPRPIISHIWRRGAIVVRI